MDNIKDILNKYARAFIAKGIARFLLWGMAFVQAKLAMQDTGNKDWVTVAADWGATVAIAGVAAGIDYLHHRLDKKQPEAK